MKPSNLRGLKRSELVELIYEQEKDIEQLEQENSVLRYKMGNVIPTVTARAGRYADREEKKAWKQNLQEANDQIAYNRRFKKTLWDTIGFLLVVAAVAILISTRFLPVLQVSGTSMEPTLEDGEILILVKNTSSMKTGDVIGFYYQNKLLIKRLIGKPGDYIDIDADGTVTVNGVVLDEPYLKEASLGECDIEFPYQVPESKYFVMGDHRGTSIDSRTKTIGCISEEQIVGKAYFRIWPFKRMGGL